MPFQELTYVGTNSEVHRKRKRKTYSCVDCRRRKLKCDRDHPCGRCVKEAHPETCVFSVDGNGSEIDEYDTPSKSYSPHDIDKPVRNGVASTHDKHISNSVARDHSFALEKKVAYLESRVANFETSNRAQLVPGQTRPVNHPEDESFFFKGKGFKTQFYGASNPTSVLSHFPEVHAFTKDPTVHSSPILRVKQDLFGMRARRKERAAQAKSVPVGELNLLSALPTMPTVHSMVNMYLDTYEYSYRIIHRPSFWATYASGDPKAWPESFIAIVLCMMATVSCIWAPELSFHDDNSVAREKAQRWVTLSDAWVQRQSQKHITTEVFQVQALLLIARATNYFNRKRAWVNSGNFLRIATCAGLHREPSDLSGKISVFDQEMRRRLWATIFEWDLQASLNRGVPPMSASIPSDCRAPSNIDDDQLEVTAQSLPDVKPSETQTDTSFLHISLQSLPLRTSLASIVNDSNLQLQFGEILQYEQRINQELDNLPAWAKQQVDPKVPLLPGTLDKQALVGIFLDVQIRQYLIFLHLPLIKGPQSAHTTYSRLACMTAANTMIQYFQRLATAGSHALNMLRNEPYQGILVISHCIFLETHSATMAQSLAYSLKPVCEQAFALFEDKVLRLGESYNHFWFASAAFALAQGACEQITEDTKRKAIERVAKLYYKVLEHQSSNKPQKQPQAASNEAPWLEKPAPTPMSDDYAMTLSQAPSLDLAANLPELEGWNLDDLWSFDNIVL